MVAGGEEYQWSGSRWTGASDWLKELVGESLARSRRLGYRCTQWHHLVEAVVLVVSIIVIHEVVGRPDAPLETLVAAVNTVFCPRFDVAHSSVLSTISCRQRNLTALTGSRTTAQGKLRTIIHEGGDVRCEIGTSLARLLSLGPQTLNPEVAGGADLACALSFVLLLGGVMVEVLLSSDRAAVGLCRAVFASLTVLLGGAKLDP